LNYLAKSVKIALAIIKNRFARPGNESQPKYPEGVVIMSNEKASDLYFELAGKFSRAGKNLSERGVQGEGKEGFRTENMLDFTMDWKGKLGHALEVPFPVVTVHKDFHCITEIWKTTDFLAIKFLKKGEKYPMVAIYNGVTNSKIVLPEEYSPIWLSDCYAPIVSGGYAFILCEIGISNTEAPFCEDYKWQWALLSQAGGDLNERRHSSIEVLRFSEDFNPDVDDFLKKAFAKEVTVDDGWQVVMHWFKTVEPLLIRSDGVIWKIFATQRERSTTLWVQRIVV
jgi:hypothetical protein